MSESKRRERVMGEARRRLLAPTSFEDACREVDVAAAVLVIGAARTGRVAEMIEALHANLVQAIGAITPAAAGDRLAEELGAGLAAAVRALRATAAATGEAGPATPGGGTRK